MSVTLGQIFLLVTAFLMSVNGLHGNKMIIWPIGQLLYNFLLKEKHLKFI